MASEHWLGDMHWFIAFDPQCINTFAIEMGTLAFGMRWITKLNPSYSLFFFFFFKKKKKKKRENNLD